MYKLLDFRYSSPSAGILKKTAMLENQTMKSWRSLNPINLINLLFGKGKSKSANQALTEEEELILDSHPWQNGLDQLAKKYGEPEVNLNESRTRIRSMAGTEAEEKFVELCKKVEKDKAPAANNQNEDQKRKADCTNHDLSAWWGESVATWDPLLAKNVDSVERQGRRRQGKWFDKQTEATRDRTD